MKDGVRLAVTLYMPDGGKAGEKFPAVLEYHPYRKDDGTAQRDYALYSYFVRRGYVCARVDIRGFGASEGVPTDREYSEQEQLDGLQIISWLAHQPWSNGNVGMMGISWSGFNSLQMAMRHAPELKAIIAVAATAELFHDDVHYMDGMAHVDEFELNMDMAPGMTGAPDYTLDEKVLGPRFDAPPWSLLYLKHQHDGPFWRSPVRPYSEIKIPCFIIGGLLDGYRDSITDMLQQTKAPLKAIVGPWNHTFPHDAVPGPQIEWRDEAVRWWDYWLKGRDTGVLQDPKLVIYMQHWHPPDPNLQNVPGEWRREDSWPPRDVRETVFFPQPNHTLAETAPEAETHQLKYIPSVGVEAGFWWGELLSDPRPVDAFSLVYDSAPLKEELAILGRPRALLQASATAPLADWFARLSDVAPDGTVTQITGAGINGAQRESMTEPRDLEPGKVYPLDIKMHLTSWVFPKGHRIRAGDFECAVADDLAHALFDDHIARDSEETRARGSTAAGGSRERRTCSRFRTAATFRGTPGHQEHRLSLARRVDTRARRGQSEGHGALEGQSGNQLSLGKGNRLRKPGLRRGRCPSRDQRSPRRSGKHLRLEGPRAQMARTSVGDHRPEEFLLQVHAGIAERRSDVEAEDVGRNHSARPPVKLLKSLSSRAPPRAALARREQVEGPLSCHGLIGL